LKTALKKLLEKGDTVKLKYFKLMLKTLKVPQGVRDDRVGRILDDLNMARERVRNQWQMAVAGY